MSVDAIGIGGGFSDAFARNISLSNVDALLVTDDRTGLFAVETKGFIVWIECKRVGEIVTRGQGQTLQEFSKKPGCVAMVLWGLRSEPKQMQVCCGGKWRDKRNMNRDDFFRLMWAWFEWADYGGSQFNRNPLSW